MEKVFKSLLNDRLLIILTCVSAGMVALIALGCGFTIGPDGSEYVAAAFQLFNPQKYGHPSEYIGLFYSIFLRLLFAVGGGWAFNVFHHYLPAFFVPIIIYAALKPFHRTAAFLCGVFVAIDVNSMFHFAVICSEGVYIFWLAVILLTFCRLLQNLDSGRAAYAHGLSLVILSLTRAAGRFFWVLFPFYLYFVRSSKALGRLLLSFILPVIVIYLVMTGLPLINFPGAMIPLTFLRTYGMVNEKSVAYQRLAECTAHLYFEHPLSESKYELFWNDFKSSSVVANNMLTQISWLEHPREFDQLVNVTFMESIRGLSFRSIFKAIKTFIYGFFVQSEFTPVPMIYNSIFSYEGSRPDYAPKNGVAGEMASYQERYGSPVNKTIRDGLYRKYCLIDWSDFNRSKLNPFVEHGVGRLTLIFPIFVTHWVFILSMLFLFLHGKAFREYKIVVIWGLIIYLYNFVLTMFLGPQERYRAPTDMFYFIPVAWFYAFLLFDKDWKSVWKWAGWILLPVMILLNVEQMSPPLKDYYRDNPYVSFMSKFF